MRRANITGLQSRRIRLYRRHSRNTHGSTICRHMRHTIHHLPERAPEFCWESRMFQLHCWICCYCSKRPGAVGRRKDSRHEEMGHRTWISQLYGCGDRCMRCYRSLAWSKIWQEDHDGLHHHLQSNRRSECRCDTRSRSCCCRTGIRQVRRPVQGVVPICATGICCRYPAYRDHLPQRESSHCKADPAC